MKNTLKSDNPIKFYRLKKLNNGKKIPFVSYKFVLLLAAVFKQSSDMASFKEHVFFS